MKHRLVFHRTDEGYAVEVPDLPGCWSQGATEAEARANIDVAMREYLEVRGAVERGMADADAGRVVPHDEARRRLGL